MTVQLTEYEARKLRAIAVAGHGGATGVCIRLMKMGLIKSRYVGDCGAFRASSYWVLTDAGNASLLAALETIV